MSYRFVPPVLDVGRGITPASGAKLIVYDVGTSTPKTTYAEFALSTANANPVVADANGRFGDIFLSGNADFTLTDSADVTIWGPKTVYDPTNSISGLAATSVSIADAGGVITATNVETALQEIATDFLKTTRADTVSANITFGSSAELISPIFRGFAIKHAVVSSASNVLTLDLSTANSFTTTLTENVTTLTISNVPTGYVPFELRVIQDGGGGAYNITQPGTVLTPGGTGVTITTSNDAIDRLTYVTENVGTSFLLDVSQAYA